MIASGVRLISAPLARRALTLTLFLIGLMGPFSTHYAGASPGPVGRAPLAIRSTALSPADRLACQTAVEEVCWQHRLWPEVNPTPKPELAAFLPPAAIQAKVDQALAYSAALDAYWQQPITGAMLQAEMERIASASRQPDIIAGIYAALGHDPALVAECLARPVLAQRLLYKWFAQDERFAGRPPQRRLDRPGDDRLVRNL